MFQPRLLCRLLLNTGKARNPLQRIVSAKYLNRAIADSRYRLFSVAREEKFSQSSDYLELPYAVATVQQAVDAISQFSNDEKRYSESSISDALTSTFSLLSNNKENCKLYGELGGCDAVVESLRNILTRPAGEDYSGVVCLHQIVIGLLGCDLTQRENLNKLALNGSLSVVAQVLLRPDLTHDVRLAGASCQAFMQLYAKALPGPSDLTPIVRAVFDIGTKHMSHPLALKETLSLLGFVLASMQTTRNDSVRTLLLEQNTPSWLVAALDMHGDRPDLVASVMFCAQGYVLSGKGNVPHLEASGIIERQAVILSRYQSDEKICMYSSLFLGYVLSHREPRTVQRFVELLNGNGTATILKEIVAKSPEDSAVTKNVLNVLSILTEHDTTEKD